MSRYLLSRLLQALVTTFGIMTIVFFVMRLSGDPVLLLVPEGATREHIDAIRRELGFDQPLWKQYLAFLKGLAQFELGASVVQRVPAWDILASRIPYTLALAGAALLVAIGFGVPAGIAMAVWRGRWFERPIAAIVVTGQSMPTFLSGILMIMLFAVTLRWLPSSGVDGPASVIMPAVALGLLSMSTFARMARIAVVDELGKDYVRAGLARGLSIGNVVARHVLRNAAIPVVTIAALEVGNLLAGAIIIETVFAWPGIGQLAIQSIQSRDFLVVQAIVLFVSLVYVAVNLVTDLLYAAIDPRIRLADQ
ncbi:MAG: ABC transporter permease [Bosea sp.]|jgi:peptide/nickel transport system permease protein|nr:ABC transporter permease [Bosea sp. (in: a-proteobacteria)]